MAFVKSEAMKAEIEARKDRIIGAVIAIAASHGADAATITAVARRSRVSQGLVCKYFADRTELNAAAVESVRLRVAGDIAKVFGDDPAGSLARVIAVIYASMGSRALNAFMFESVVYREALREPLARLLVEGGVHGPRSAKTVSSAILGALRGIADDAASLVLARSDAVRLALLLAGMPARKAERFSKVSLIEA